MLVLLSSFFTGSQQSTAEEGSRSVEMDVGVEGRSRKHGGAWLHQRRGLARHQSNRSALAPVGGGPSRAAAATDKEATAASGSRQRWIKRARVRSKEGARRLAVRMEKGATVAASSAGHPWRPRPWRSSALARRRREAGRGGERQRERRTRELWRSVGGARA